PCGRLGDSRRPCECPEPLVERYRARVSGPLLDRIDLHVEVGVPTLRELRAGEEESSRAVAQRVAAARQCQAQRYPGRALPVNASMTPADLTRCCALDSAGQRLLDAAFERLGLSARAYARVLKVA